MTAPNPLGNASSWTGPTVFDTNEIVIKKRIFSLREHYDIEDRAGNRLAEGEGNFIQIPAIFQVKDPRTGMPVMQIEGEVFTLHNQFTFIDNLGVELGTIRKKIVKFIGEEFWIEKGGVDLMRIYGDFLEHDYSMEINGQKVAHVHRDWVSLRDQYGISILGEVDHRLVVGATIVIEHIEVNERRARS